MNIHDATETAYKNGYAKGFADGKGEWIGVEERLPDFEGKYLACTINGNVTIAYCYSPFWESNPQFDYWVTHWMPLPAPPKGE